MNIENRAIGCMLAAAYGDTLGASIEFYSLGDIERRFGSGGICVPQPAFGHCCPVISDDTQMAIATLRGLLSSNLVLDNDDKILQNIWSAYLGWYDTQKDPAQMRAPGNTCISALQGALPGSSKRPINRSAGCGGVMRVHPIGIAFSHDPQRAFRLGMESAALTHGDAKAFLPAGFLAMLIAFLVQGEGWTKAIELTWHYFMNFSFANKAVVSKTITDALFMAEPSFIDDSKQTVLSYGKFIDLKVGQSLIGGGGWLGHDALAISLFAVKTMLANPIKAIEVSVNHSGDSDSTGCLAGAIVGAIYGSEPVISRLESLNIELERKEEMINLVKQLSLTGGKK